MSQTETFDGVLLGSGHNSLILQAYLGRAGLRTVCLEQGPRAGGGLTTEEAPAGTGFLHNTHSFFHRGVTHLPWFADLELESRGARYLQPALNVALILRDGRALKWWSQFERTCDSFAQFDRRDADELAVWRERFRPIVREILEPEAAAPPLPSAQRERRLRQTAEGRLLLEISQLTPLEFVERHFRDPVIRAGLLFFNGLREVDLRCPGFGHHIPALLASDRMAQMCVGGSAQLADALVRAVTDTGGQVHVNASPRRLLVEDGAVRGVELSDGRQFRGRFVASGLNPQQTFLELLPVDPLANSSSSSRTGSGSRTGSNGPAACGPDPPPWHSQAAAFEYNLLAPLFGLYLNLRQPPQYLAAQRDPELDQALMVILGLEHFEQFGEIVAAHQEGTIPRTVMWGACPTQFDPSQAPPGQHTAFMWEKLPYALRGDPAHWDDEKQRHAAEMLEVWREFAPNLNDDVVVYWFCRSPRDTERMLPNMRGGDLLVGAFSNGQVGYNRPFAGAGHYRAPVPGLYLCGSSSHPGGNVTGLPGYNCAQVLLADLNLPHPGKTDRFVS